MKNIKTLFAGAAGLIATSAALAGANESANLSATISAGTLEIVASSLSGTYTPVGGAVAITGATQTDALDFEINGITIRDLDGNGSGFTLTANADVALTNGTINLPRGTVGGFNGSSNPGSTTVDTPNQITYNSGSGVNGYTIDYDVAYTVPALAEAGTYTGVVAFAITSL